MIMGILGVYFPLIGESESLHPQSACTKYISKGVDFMEVFINQASYFGVRTLGSVVFWGILFFSRKP